MAKEQVKEQQNTPNLEMELLKAKLELLEGKVSKPQTSEEAFQQRVEQYESKKAERDALQAQVNQRRLEIMSMPELMGKARMDEVIILESWERRAKSIEQSNPDFARRLRYEFKKKVQDIAKDTTR